ncbi:hypothetical protein [Streptomyces sp. NPDC002644]
MMTGLRTHIAGLPRTLAAAAAGLALAASALLTTAPAARADTVTQTDSSVLVDCLGSVTSTFSPGLHLLPATITLSSSGPLGTCVGGDADHVTGSYTASGTGTLSCTLNLPLPASGTVTWRDADGKVSDVSQFTALAVPLRPLGQNVVAVTGTITTGDYTGRGIVLEFVLPNIALTACLTPAGATGAAGPANITVLPV